MGKTVVVAGGTDGIGRGLVLALAGRGDRVVAIGSKPEKGRRLLESTADAPGGVSFVAVDLSTAVGCADAIVQVGRDAKAVDALVLCANRQQPKRRETADGLEATFALYYLSRYLLGYGLLDRLEAASRPVIVNVAGPGITKGKVHWEDLQLRRRYGGVRAQLQAGRANDLLGVAFAATQPAAKTRYVLYHPGFTDTGFAEIAEPVRTLIRIAARFKAQPVDAAVAPIVEFLDDPPTAPVSAFDRREPVDLSLATFDRDDALRLDAATRALLHDS